MSFRVTGLSPDPFKDLFGLSDEALAAQNIQRYIAEPGSAYPDRIEMRDAEPGETLLLLNHEYQPASTPYRARHAIFVREWAEETYDRVGEVPQAMRTRLLSLRAFDADDMIVDADVIDGSEVERLIERLFAKKNVAYIQAHNAKRGCFSGRIDRA